MQLAQDVVRDVARVRVSPCRKIGISAFLWRISPTKARRSASVSSGSQRQFFVVDRQDEGRGAALLLRERGQVAVAGDAEHFQALLLDRFGQRADAEAGGVLGAEVFVDDDDREVKAHVESLKCSDPPQRVTE